VEVSDGNKLLPADFDSSIIAGMGDCVVTFWRGNVTILSFSTKYHLNKHYDYYITLLERFAKGVGTGALAITAAVAVAYSKKKVKK